MFPDELALSEFDKDAETAHARAGLNTGAGRTTADFEEIFERYHPLVFHLAYRILGEREEALDVCQEVFLQVYCKLGRFRGESSVKTWIYRIAINRATNRCRWWNRLRRRGAVSLEEHLSRHGRGGWEESVKSPDDSPEETLIKLEEHEQLERSLARLPLQQRLVLVLRDIEGMSYEEIAQLLELSLGTVKSRISRGREDLKRRLNGSLRPVRPGQVGGVS